MLGIVCLSGVKVSLETQNELLDLAAHHLGNISAEETLKPLEVLKEFLNLQLYGRFMSSPCYMLQNKNILVII